MQRHIGVGLGALLALLICTGGEAAARDGRYGVGGYGPGAGSSEISAARRGYAAPGGRTLSPVRRGEGAGEANERAGRAYGSRAAGAWDYGAARAYGYRAATPARFGGGAYGGYVRE